MRSHAIGSALVCGIVVVGVLTPGVLAAGEEAFQSNFGGTFFSSQTPCPTKDFPPLETVTPIPLLIDPFEEDFIPVFCDVQFERKGKPVKNVRGRFQSTLVMRDNQTGMFSDFEIDSGRVRTNSEGSFSFDFEIDTEIFADGFESGDVSAWSYTRVEPKKRKADRASMSCSTSGSGSD